MSLEFGDFVLFKGNTLAIVSYDEMDDICGLTFLNDGAFRKYIFKTTKELEQYLVKTYKEVKFIKKDNMIINYI